jgi:hypothetical protein
MYAGIMYTVTGHESEGAPWHMRALSRRGTLRVGTGRAQREEGFQGAAPARAARPGPSERVWGPPARL